MKVAVMDITNNVSQDELDAGRLQENFSVEVSQGKKVTLPEAFSAPVREDIIKLAIASARANRRQAYGSNAHVGKRAPMAGMKHSVEWWGKGRGVSRIMRKTGQRTGAQNPHTRGGRRAHGPKVAKDWSQKLNSKQRTLARNSAIAATINPEMVSSRGHNFDEKIRFPIVIDGYKESRDGSTEKYDVESLPLQNSTRKFVAMMRGLGLGGDLDRAKSGRNIRAGKGTMRGRKYRTPKSILLVVASREGLHKAARNVPGVDVVAAKDLCAEDLAPGGDMGRLTVWTKAAIEAME